MACKPQFTGSVVWRTVEVKTEIGLVARREAELYEPEEHLNEAFI